MKAKPIRTTKKTVYEQRLWGLEDGTHVVSSSVHDELDGRLRVHETMVFPSDAEGRVEEWGELGVIRQTGEHEAAIRAAGYEPQTPTPDEDTENEHAPVGGTR